MSEPTKPRILVHVHCGACDWDGVGDPADDCYRCHEDCLNEVNPMDERCIHCGNRAAQCDCDEL